MPRELSRGALIRRVAAKETTLAFNSPIAYMFLAAFAAVTLFVFFWGEAFFARNIADVRPLFETMPLLLLFLASTITMRLWSEERRTGTLEYVLTQPAPLWIFVAGKFCGCLALLLCALAITLPLPVTVAVLGELDWGPVWAGYLAALLLGAAYLSIGLFVSALCRNQIVSLLGSVALCGLFYLVGTDTITELFGHRGGEWLRLLGTGSRFDAITRGVIDLRDLYYYLTIILAFLALNTTVLERARWARGAQRGHHRAWQVGTALLVANALAANLWLGQLPSLRIDATEGRQYSISDTTQGYLDRLREPLLLRGYFSAQTHPLLAPLVPRLRDLMREYAVAGGDRVRVEFIDPQQDPEAEAAANREYGIEPVPFQMADRYQSSIVSSYFNVVVQYGDEHEVLGFRDLIEVRARGENDIDVRLRNPEYDLTRSIKQVLRAYQSAGNLFDTVAGQLEFTAYLSPAERLPDTLASFADDMRAVLEEKAKAAGGRLAVREVDPEANDGAVARRIAGDFGFQPLATGLFSEDQFYFYMTLGNDQQVVQIPLEDASREAFERNLDAAIKRFASGFTKTVALVTPQGAGPYGPAMGGPAFRELENFLGAELNIQREDLSDGRVSGDADLLLLAAPENLDQRQLFAVDQFLMQGGTVIAATSPFSANLGGRNLALNHRNSGLEDWLAHHGLTIGEQLVMDPQNAAFPVPVTRHVGGLALQELRMLDYPYFVDLRGEGLAPDHPVTADLPQLTMAWASPIELALEQGQREVTALLHSSGGAWLSDSLDIVPAVGANGVSGFAPQGEQSRQLLGVISRGRFESWFAGKPSPLLEESTAPDAGAGEESEDTAEDSATAFSGVIEHSPASAAIILFSSNDFLRDDVLGLAGSALGSEYLGSLQLVTNAVDWALEDEALLGIRGRGHFNRTLPPLEQGTRMFWEYLNYGLAALALTLVSLWHRYRQNARHRHYVQQLAH